MGSYGWKKTSEDSDLPTCFCWASQGLVHQHFNPICFFTRNVSWPCLSVVPQVPLVAEVFVLLEAQISRAQTPLVQWLEIFNAFARGNAAPTLSATLRLSEIHWDSTWINHINKLDHASVMIFTSLDISPACHSSKIIKKKQTLDSPKIRASSGPSKYPSRNYGALPTAQTSHL